jgi:sugar lactone lactonase YvrE
MRSIARSDLEKLWAIVIPCALLLGCAAGDADGPTTAVAAELVAPPPGGAPPTTCATTTDIVVSDDLAFGAGAPGLIWIDPLLGYRSALSSNVYPGGPPFGAPKSLVFDALGQILAIDSGTAAPNPALVRVDPYTGLRTIVSNNVAPAGTTPFVEPTGIAVEPTGMILVTDLSAFAAADGGVFRVNPTNGNRTVLSTNGIASGPRFENPSDVAVTSTGEIYVVDAGNMVSTGSVISVDRMTGRRRVISANATATGPRFVYPRAIAVDAAGSILVSDRDAFGGSGGIIRVDAATGARSTVSSNLSAGGPPFSEPGDLVVDGCDRILITDSGADAVYSVDATSGARTILSNNVTPGGTPAFVASYGIAVR